MAQGQGGSKGWKCLLRKLSQAGGARLVGWLALILLAHFLSDLAWMWTDHLVPDGDALGQLGAIELYRSVVQERGARVALLEAFYGTGDYPPLFALLYALPLAWFPFLPRWDYGLELLLALTSTSTVWAVFGLTRALARSQPRLLARVLNRSTADAPSTDLRSAASWIGLLGALVYATFPLSTSLGREAMPEPLVALWVTLALWAVLETRDFTRPIFAILAGLALLLAGLTKQTSVLYVFGPVGLLGVIALVRVRARALVGLLLLTVTAAPLPLYWLWLHRGEQQAYLERSADAKAEVGWLEHVVYYPAALLGQGVGLLWALPLLLVLVLLLRRRAWMPLALFFVLLLTLTLVPKKYERLLVPVLPLTAAVLALGLGSAGRSRPARLAVAALLGAAVTQQFALSVPLRGVPERLGVWRPAYFEAVDPGCFQDWIRPYTRSDLGLNALLQTYVRAGSQAGRGITFLSELDIPCDYQTTFPLSMLLTEYARPRGVELGEVPVAERELESFRRAVKQARLVVGLSPWCEPLDETRVQNEPQCEARGAFDPVGDLHIRLGDTPRTLYVYQRISAASPP